MKSNGVDFLSIFLAWRASGADFYVDMVSHGGPTDNYGWGTLQGPRDTMSRIVAGGARRFLALPRYAKLGPTIEQKRMAEVNRVSIVEQTT